MCVCVCVCGGGGGGGGGDRLFTHTMNPYQHITPNDRLNQKSIQYALIRVCELIRLNIANYRSR